jgi:hypothetical protein
MRPTGCRSFIFGMDNPPSARRKHEPLRLCPYILDCRGDSRRLRRRAAQGLRSAECI